MITEFKPTNWKRTLLGACVAGVLIMGGLTSAQNSESNVATTSSEQSGYTISGRCVDGNGRPLKDVRVRVFRVSDSKQTRELVSDIETDKTGTYKFTDLPMPNRIERRDPPESDLVEYETYYLLTAAKSGHVSRIHGHLTPQFPFVERTLTMPVAGILSGKVTDTEGRPVSGAHVFTYSYPATIPLEGILSDMTDSEGRFEIADLEIWNAHDQESEQGPDGDGFVIGSMFFRTIHPDYGFKRSEYTAIPSRVDVTLSPESVVEGQVNDQVIGQPAAGVTVSLRAIDLAHESRQVTTDKQGRYRFTSVEAGKYNICADADERIAVSIESLEVTAGNVYSNQDILLIEGSWIEGHVVDAKMGDPISHRENGQQLTVGVHGPARPKSSGAVNIGYVADDGRFRIRVAPGVNYPYIMIPDVWQRTEDFERYKEGIEVADGEIVSLEFRVLPERPRKKPKFSPVRLQVPVSEEREAAAAVRRLGGWYELDDDRHVVEVNMVYHKTADDVRYDNDQSDTDEVLRWVPQFLRLKRLLLTEGQVTDESMRFVAELPDLEVFYVWSAHRISDAGVQHLQWLDNLTQIHLGGSQIGDASLKVFGGLVNLERLSLQGNCFTDDGIRDLAGLTSLKGLWISSSKAKLSNSVVEHLAKLTNLEELDLQRVPITDAGVSRLAALTKLRQLYLGGAPPESAGGITNVSADVLAELKDLETLFIQSCRMTDDGALKLAQLPHLKKLSLAGATVTPETKESIEAKHPDAWINIPTR